MRKNSILRSASAAALEGKWMKSALSVLIYCLVYALLYGLVKGLTSEAFANLFCFIFLLPLSWGLYCIFLEVFRGKNVELKWLIDGYKETRVLGTMLLMTLYTYLWFLLLIIPGIIKSFSYAMTPYILRDYPELSYNAAIEKSMAMMKGYKMKLFLLYLSFIGWALLCILTLGIGYFFLMPYMYTSISAFYEDLKEQQAEQVIVAETIE